jgi:hypothetical protein
MMGISRDMGDRATVGIWTRCPACAEDAVAVVQFIEDESAPARLVDFRCPTRCSVEARSVLRRVRLAALDRAS